MNDVLTLLCECVIMRYKTSKNSRLIYINIKTIHGLQSYQMIKCRIENNSLDIRIIHCQPTGGEASDAPSVKNDIFNREIERLCSILDDGICRPSVLTGQWRPRAAPEAGVIPAQNRITSVERRFDHSHLVKTSISVANDYQIISVFSTSVELKGC